jgi:hypothetical protein
VTSRAQKQVIVAQLQRGELPMPVGRFERLDPRSHSERVRCVLCGATGLGSTNPTVWELTGSHWQIMCLMPHPVRCRCGLSFRTESHLGQHVNARHYPERALMHGPVSR